MICSNKFFLILLSLFAGISLLAAPPVPFSGKLAINGKNFHGNALFSFSIVDGGGTVHWKHADEPDSKIENFVMNGRYLVLLGGQGMRTLPADLFLQHESLFLRVSVDLKDGKGMRLLEPDQRITSSPYALSADLARLAERAKVAGEVDMGAITANMLEQGLLADLNRTFELGPISRDMLEEALQDDLNRTITRDRLSQDLIADLNRTVRLQDLSEEVSQSINRPITREMLPQGVRDELNATITRDRLSADVRADLNRTVGITNLSSEVTEKLNRDFTIEPGSIGKALLAQDVRDDLNRTITRDRLSGDIIADLNRTVRLQDLSEEVSQSINRPITREMLPQGVRDELNATITRDRLSADVRADLNRTVRLQDLSPEVSQSINRSITLSDFDSQVITELNNSISPGSITLDQLSQQVRDDINRTITRDRLSSDVLSDINRTITKSMLSQEVLDELNASGGATGSVPGSLIAVPANQSAPSGYELYQMGDRKELVWEEKAAVSVARFAYDGVEVLGGKIYFIGGYDGLAKKIAKRYDPTTDSWEALPDMTVAREGLASAVLDGRLYAIGGVGLSSVEVFDPTLNSWDAGTALPNVLRLGTALTVNGKIYLFGGQSSNQNSNQVLCFDPSTSQWTSKANMPTARHGMKLVWFENRIWVIGGGNGSSTNIVESYDPTTDTWQTEVSLTSTRNWPVAWVSNGRIYVGGGNDGPSFLNHIEVYDPVTKQWSSAGTFPENKWGSDSVVSYERVYVIAGATASGVYSNKVFAADLNASVEGVHDLYVKTGDASTGTPTVQAEVADGSIGPSKLSSEVSNALKPVVVGQPSSVVEHAGMPTYLAVDATGGDNTYQWKKDGVDITGATSSTLSISDLNASQHEGNYTVVVSNAFGSVTSSVAQIDVNGSLTEGLVGWWKFDETEGNIAYDSSGNGNDGNLTNGPTWTEGKIGGALSFDGVDDYVNFGVRDVFNLESEISVSLWIKASDYKYAQVISKSTLSGAFTWAFKWRVSTERFYFRIYDPSGQYVSFLRYNQNPPLNEWSNILFSYGDSNSKLYLNSNLEAEGDFTATLTNQTNPLLLGGAGSEMFFGLIDDVRIYDRALSAFEVKALYEMGEQPVQESGAGTTTVVNGTVADGSIGPSKLSSEVSNALKPVVVGQPSSVVGVGGARTYLAVDVDGVNLSYQWKKDGVDIAGATGSTLSIADLNASQHEGNYTLVVSNAFGSTTSSVAQIDVNGSLTEGLVGWWKFDETEGNIAYDSSGNGNDGNLTNGPTWTVGKIGGALNFDGVDDRVKIPHTILDQKLAFTVSLWFNMKLGSDSSYHAFITAANSSDANAFTFEKRPTHNMMIRDMGEVSSSSAETSDFWTSTWRHVTFTKSSVGIVFYLSGEELDSKNYSTATMSVDANGLWIGPDQDSVGGGWQSGQSVKGELDDFRIYDRALTAFEVRALHKLGEQSVGSVVTGSGATTVVNGTVADGSITTNQLSEQILKYLKPEITQQPTAGTIYADTNHTFSVSAEGKYLTYQWKKNGVNLTGETNATLTITDANATQHDGNYSVVVSNDFGNVESGDLEILISVFLPTFINNLELWLDASDQNSFSLENSAISQWLDKSPNNRLFTQSVGNQMPEVGEQRVIFAEGDFLISTNALQFDELNIFYVKKSTDVKALDFWQSESGARYSLVFDSSSASSAQGSQFGNPSYFINANLVSISTRAAAKDLFHDGETKLISIINCSTANWPKIQIGNYNGYEFSGEYYEIIFVSGEISTSDRAALEGYLAHKWNLATELPSDHPYKNSAP